MAREVRADTNDYTIEWDEAVGAVVHTWTDFTTGQDFRDGADHLLDAIRECKATKVIVDTSNVQAHDEADKQWLQERWIPRMIDAGVAYSATVHADSVISQMEMEGMNEAAGERVGAEQFMTNDFSEARQWIADKP